MAENKPQDQTPSTSTSPQASGATNPALPTQQSDVTAPPKPGQKDPARDSKQGAAVVLAASLGRPVESVIGEDKDLQAFHEAVRAGSGGDAANVNSGLDTPTIGETVYVKAVFGLIVDPTTKPVTNILVDKPTKVTFNGWHIQQWNAGKITEDK